MGQRHESCGPSESFSPFDATLLVQGRYQGVDAPAVLAKQHGEGKQRDKARSWQSGEGCNSEDAWHTSRYYWALRCEGGRVRATHGAGQ